MRLFRVLSLSLALLAVPSCVVGGDDDDIDFDQPTCFYAGPLERCGCVADPEAALPECNWCRPCKVCSPLDVRGNVCDNEHGISACLPTCPR